MLSNINIIIYDNNMITCLLMAGNYVTHVAAVGGGDGKNATSRGVLKTMK